MATDVTSLNIDIGGKADGAIRAISSVNRELDGLQKKASGTGIGGRAREFFREQRASGETAVNRLLAGGTERLFDFAVGGGPALAVATFGVQKLAEGFNGLAESLEKYRKGEKSGGQMFGDFVDALPAASQVYALADSFNHLFAVWTHTAGPSAEQVERIQKLQETISESNQRARGIGLKGFDRERFDARQALTKDFQEINKLAPGDEGNQLRLNAKKQYAAAAKEIDKQEAEQRIQINKDAFDRIHDMEQQNIERRLRLSGDTLGANLERIEAESLAKQKVVRERVRKDQEKDPANAMNIFLAGKGEIAGIRKSANEQIAAAGEEDRDSRLAKFRSGEQELWQFKIGLAQDEAEKLTGMDRQRADEQIELMKKAADFQSRINAAEELAADKTQSKFVRDQAQDLVTKLQKARSAALEAPSKVQAGITLPTDFQFTSAETLTGVQGRFGTTADPVKDVADNTAPVPDLLKDINDTLQGLAQLMARNQPAVAGI